ncbi:MAG TPA: amino acid permease [Cyclobacteriaceae bacterium]|nr:amino acid permease [Cyclobacteriaceae bacterium]
MKASEDEGLKKVIGVRSLAANAVNLTVGSGIFVLPAVVATYLGAASFLAYILCAILMGLVLLCFMEVGSKIPVTGGVYAYIEAAFGPFAGFLGSSLFWLGYCIMADAAVANILADSLSTFFPAFNHSIVRVIFLALMFGGIAWLNVRGIQQGNALVEFITIVKLLPLIILIVVGFFFVDTKNYNVYYWPSVRELGQVSLILFFSFIGMEASLSAGGEVKNPRKTIPRGIFLGMFIIFSLYVLVQFVAQGVLGAELPLHQFAPLAEVGETILGDIGKLMIVIGAAISGFGLISGDIMITSRVPYAAARDGLLPKFLSAVHPKFSTPYISVIFYAGIGFIMSISGGFRELAILASSSMLIIYVGVILATIKLRKMPAEEGSFVIPGGITIPIIALLVTAWFLSNLSKGEIAGGLIFLAATSVVYFLMKVFRK